MKSVEFNLKSIRIEENGELEKKPAATMLSAELLYPRPNVTNVVSLKAMKLDYGQEIDFEDEENPASQNHHRQ